MCVCDVRVCVPIAAWQNGKCMFSHDDIVQMCIVHREYLTCGWWQRLHRQQTVTLMMMMMTPTIASARMATKHGWHSIYLTQLNISNHFIFMRFVNLSCHSVCSILRLQASARSFIHTCRVFIYFSFFACSFYCQYMNGKWLLAAFHFDE